MNPTSGANEDLLKAADERVAPYLRHEDLGYMRGDTDLIRRLADALRVCEEEKAKSEAEAIERKAYWKDLVAKNGRLRQDATTEVLAESRQWMEEAVESRGTIERLEGELEQVRAVIVGMKASNTGYLTAGNMADLIDKHKQALQALRQHAGSDSFAVDEQGRVMRLERPAGEPRPWRIRKRKLQ